MLTLNPAAGFIVGCEIGVDFILVVCTNFAPEIIWRHEEHTDPGMGQEAILARAKALLNDAIQRGYQEYGTLLGIGVGVAALIDQSTGLETVVLFKPVACANPAREMGALLRKWFRITERLI